MARRFQVVPVRALEQFQKLCLQTREGFNPLQGYLVNKKLQPPLGPLHDPRHGPSVGSRRMQLFMSDVLLYLLHQRCPPFSVCHMGGKGLEFEGCW